jgi:hypothetical protein
MLESVAGQLVCDGSQFDYPQWVTEQDGPHSWGVGELIGFLF